MAVGEALANAVEHGGHVEQGWFEVAARRDAATLVIEVKDAGAGFDHARLRSDLCPAVESVRGYGTFIMRQLMDSVEYFERGTRLRLTKRMPTAFNEAAAREA